MQSSSEGVINLGQVVRRRLPIGLIVSLGLIVVTLALALGLPSIYRSRAVVLIEAQEIPQDLVRSLVTSYADQRMQIISQRVLTNSNLASIIQKYDLYAEERRKDTLEKVIEEMREDISILPVSADVVDPRQGKAVKATIAFELAYENQSPDLAQRVANEIVSLFLNENLKQRSETAEDALGFLSLEADKLRGNVAELEEKLAVFKKKNQGRLPELANVNIELMNRTEAQLLQLDTQLQSLNQQRVYLESELVQQKPTSTTLISETGQRILGAADRLKVLESEFVPLSARYGASHPDVIAKRKEIESLKKELGISDDSSEMLVQLESLKSQRQTLRERYSPKHPDVIALNRQIESLESSLRNTPSPTAASSKREIPDNPVYIQLKARLDATQADIASMHAQKSALRTKLNDLETRMTEAPEVEREYRMLTRDYEIAQVKYQEVLAKRQEAELAGSLESNQRGERFTMIEPPVVPEEPSKPNRLAIGLLGVLLAIAGGVGSGAIAEAVDDRVYGRSGVATVLGVPPLAVVPNLMTSISLAKRRKTWLIIIGAIFLATALVGVIIHFFVSPLDVTYFRVMRKLGV